MARNGRTTTARRDPPQRRSARDEDDIDDQGSSQPQSQGQAVRVKAEKVAKARRARDDVEDDDDVGGRGGGGAGGSDDGDEEGKARMREIQELTTNWKDQPIPASEAKRLRGLQVEWDWISNQFSEVYLKYNNTALQLQSAGNPVSEESADVRNMDISFRDLLDAEVAADWHLKALKAVENGLERGTIEGNPENEYKFLVAEKKEAYRTQTSRAKYAKNQDYRAFRESIWEARMPGEPMAPLTQTIDREDGDEEDSDDDIVMGGVTQDYKCPITLTTFMDPVTSTKCPHSFSREAIFSMFKTPTIKCPAQGCGMTLQRADLKPNRDLQQRVKAFVRREKERERREREEGIDVDDDDD